MEIQLQKFNEWMQKVDSFIGSLPDNLFDSESVISYNKGAQLALTKEQTEIIEGTTQKIKLWSKEYYGEAYFHELAEEINLNITFIDNTKTLENYLKFIRERINGRYRRYKLLTNHKLLYNETNYREQVGETINGITSYKIMHHPIARLLSFASRIFIFTRIISLIDRRLMKFRYNDPSGLIKYEAFNDWINSSFGRTIYYEESKNNIVLFKQTSIFAEYLNGEKPNINDPELENLRQLNYKLRLVLVVFKHPIKREIEINIANINSQSQVERYLNFIKDEVTESLNRMKNDTAYHEIINGSIDIYKTDSNNNYIQNDIIGNLLRDSIMIIDSFIWLEGFIQQKINPNLTKKQLQKPLKLSDDPFTSLFKYKYQKHIDKFIDILRYATPDPMPKKKYTLISTENKWTGVKGAAKVYIEELEDKDILEPKLTHEMLYMAFDYKFKTGRAFMRNSDAVEANDFRSDIAERIDILKQQID